VKRGTGILVVCAAALSAGCTVQPLTPTPAPTATLPVVAILVATFTPTANSGSIGDETSVPDETATAAVTLGLTETPAATAAISIPGQAESGAAGLPRLTPAPQIEVAASDARPPDNGSTPATVSGDVAAAEQYAIDLINAQRAMAGVPPLARDETLMGIAQARVADMIARGYTGHNDPVTGVPLAQDMMRTAGYTSTYLGENWYGSIKPPPAIVDVAMTWFMTDPPHARNILSPSYVAVGIGLGYNGRQWLLIQNFAGPNE
jgi:uncharacterized protein YkwD